MRLSNGNHLCYSLNVFPSSESGFVQNIEQVVEKFCEIRRDPAIGDTTPIALGLWLDAGAIEELQSTAEFAKLKSLLKQNNFYVFTVNAFPYGKFHNEPVKDNVYLPNWTSELRRDFTCKVADILSELLPEGVIGSISTLPGGYRKHFERSSSLTKLRLACRTSNYEDEIADNLVFTADHLAKIEKNTKKKIILGIEMEPDCIWESVREFCEFRKKYLQTESAGKYIGVCYDTCHQELLEAVAGTGLALLKSENIPIAKIQLSAALQGIIQNNREAVLRELANFADPVYLHQTRFFDKQNKITASFRDIPEGNVKSDDAERAVIHFHMPLFGTGISENFSVVKGELEANLAILKKDSYLCSNIEIETYTYNVLPDNIKTETIEEMITKEYRWVLKRFS